MTYCFTDFLLLYAVSVQKGNGLGDILHTVTRFIPVVPSEATVTRGFTVLHNGGYIAFDGNPSEIDASCSVRLTDKGKSAVKMPFFKKLFHAAEAVATAEKAFVSAALPIADGETVSLAAHTYDTLVHRMESSDEHCAECSFLSIRQTQDSVEMRLHLPWHGGEDGEGTSGRTDTADTPPCDTEDLRSDLATLVGGAAEDEYVPANNLTVSFERGDTGLTDLLGAVYRLVFAAEKKSRKVCLCNGQGTYVLTLSPQTDGIRVTCAPIRFNQRRFRGKTDSELDYAQCGDDVLFFTMDESNLVGMTAVAYAEVWELLSPNAHEQVQALHEASFQM